MAQEPEGYIFVHLAGPAGSGKAVAGASMAYALRVLAGAGSAGALAWPECFCCDGPGMGQEEMERLWRPGEKIAVAVLSSFGSLYGPREAWAPAKGPGRLLAAAGCGGALGGCGDAFDLAIEAPSLQEGCARLIAKIERELVLRELGTGGSIGLRGVPGRRI